MLDRLLDGRMTLDDVEHDVLDAVQRAEQNGMPLTDILGLSHGEVAALSRRSGTLRYILHAHRFGIPVARVLRGDLDLAQSELAAAARICDPGAIAALHEAHLLSQAGGGDDA